MTVRLLWVFGLMFGLMACEEQGPMIEPFGPVSGPPGAGTGPEDLLPELEQCDAADYRGLIGSNVASTTLPSDPMLRIYGENDIIVQDYLPQRTNIIYAADGTILRVTCG